MALHKTHIWANSLKTVCFLCFLLFWCPLLPYIETGTLKIYTKMVLYMQNEFLTSNTPHGVWTHTLPTLELCFSSKLQPVVDDLRENRSIIKNLENQYSLHAPTTINLPCSSNRGNRRPKCQLLFTVSEELKGGTGWAYMCLV